MRELEKEKHCCLEKFSGSRDKYIRTNATKKREKLREFERGNCLSSMRVVQILSASYVCEFFLFQNFWYFWLQKYVKILFVILSVAWESIKIILLFPKDFRNSGRSQIFSGRFSVTSEILDIQKILSMTYYFSGISFTTSKNTSSRKFHRWRIYFSILLRASQWRDIRLYGLYRLSTISLFPWNISYSRISWW